jgi:UDP-N-acetylmuramoyl-tripeptide--D-alanyl-D-alanine ligase
MGIEYSLETLSELGTQNSKRYLITPGLIELGSDQYSINYAFATEASIIIDQALVVGFTNKRSLMVGFEENNIPVNWFINRDEAVAFLNSIVESDDIVLFENDLPDHYP